MEEAQIWVTWKLPAFVGPDPIGWIARAEKIFDVQDIHSFDKMHCIHEHGWHGNALVL